MRGERVVIETLTEIILADGKMLTGVSAYNALFETI